VLTSAVDPSLYVAVAANCCVPPTKMLALPGATESEVSVLDGGGVEVLVEVEVVELGEPPPHPTLPIKSKKVRDRARTKAVLLQASLRVANIAVLCLLRPPP